MLKAVGKAGEFKKRVMDKLAHEKLMAARAHALFNRTPNELAEFRALLALKWVHQWGWSCAGILDIVAQTTRRGLSARLIKAGLLKAHKREGMAVFQRLPSQLLTLTKDGLAFVLRDLEKEPHAYRDHITWANVRHDYMVQRFCVEELFKDGPTFALCETPLTRQAQSKFEAKEPDAVLIGGPGRVAIEFEFNGKFGRKLDDFVLKCLIGANGTATQKPEFQGIWIYCGSDSMVKRYQEAFKPGKEAQRWAQTSRGHWEPKKGLGGPFKVPEAPTISIQRIPTSLMGA